MLSFPSQNDKKFFRLARCTQKADSGDDKPTYFKSGLIEKGVCDNANVIHAWNRFKTSLGKENWYRNHLSLPKI